MMSVPICNRFYARRANSGKRTTFRWYTPFDAFVRGVSPHPVAQNFVTEKLQSLHVAVHAEDFVIITGIYHFDSAAECDGQTDG